MKHLRHSETSNSAGWATPELLPLTGSSSAETAEAAEAAKEAKEDKDGGHDDQSGVDDGNFWDLQYLTI